jgi:hypothetical protein
MVAVGPAGAKAAKYAKVGPVDGAEAEESRSGRCLQGANRGGAEVAVPQQMAETSMGDTDDIMQS